MDRDLVKRRQRELSKQQAMYVAHRERGLPRQQSAIMAGYADVDKAGEQVEKSPAVKDELAKARAELAEATGTTREDIARMLKDAYDVATTMADPGAMVRAAAELGKLLGHYAPEVKKHQHELGEGTLRALERMSDSELLKLTHGRIIEGEAEVVKDGE